MLPLARLDRIREERGLTQEQLAVACGLTASTLRNYTHGRPGQQADHNIETLAAFLECSVLELYGLRLIEDDVAEAPAVAVA